MNSHVRFSSIPRCAVASAAAILSIALADAAVILDQIGPVLPTNRQYALNHELSDFPDYSTEVLEDFAVGSGEVCLVRFSALFRADGGYSSLAGVDGFRLNVFSDPGLAASGFGGDLFSAFVPPGPGVEFAQMVDPSHLAEYGIVTIYKEVCLPGPGTYWMSLTPVSSSANGYFHLVSAAPSGGNGNANLANPGGGFLLPGNISQTGLDFSYSIEAIPEPATAWLVLPGCLVLFRRRHC